MKERTKSKVKDIARDLILLYSKRKQEKGFAYSPDSFMQHELEASFIYEDTPDQMKATADVKADMENDRPMDRLICGDVGFGKTEVAIRAAFKAVSDNKQVAVLVPTTVLAFQHYQTFSERLKDFPCRIEYISRARTAKEIRETLKDLKDCLLYTSILKQTHLLDIYICFFLCRLLFEQSVLLFGQPFDSRFTGRILILLRQLYLLIRRNRATGRNFFYLDILFVIITVSYTHLDVYKRQELESHSINNVALGSGKISAPFNSTSFLLTSRNRKTLSKVTCFGLSASYFSHQLEGYDLILAILSSILSLIHI